MLNGVKNRRAQAIIRNEHITTTTQACMCVRVCV